MKSRESASVVFVDRTRSNQDYRRECFCGGRRKTCGHMPTVSLNEWGVVVRGCVVSSTPSMRVSLSRKSLDEGRGAEMGVYEANVGLR